MNLVSSEGYANKFHPLLKGMVNESLKGNPCMVRVAGCVVFNQNP